MVIRSMSYSILKKSLLILASSAALSGGFVHAESKTTIKPKLADSIMLFTKHDGVLSNCQKESEKSFRCNFQDADGEENSFDLEVLNVGRSLLLRKLNDPLNCLFTGHLSEEGINGTYHCKGMDQKASFQVFNNRNPQA